MENQTSPLGSQIGQWLRRSLFVKLLTIGFLILILLIPLMMVRDLINQRQSLRATAIGEVSGKWGASQTVAGPVLTIPYTQQIPGQDGKLEVVRRQLHLLPDSLSVDGRIEEETRRRGIFEVVLYTAHLTLSGQFPAPDLTGLDIDPAALEWDRARVAIGLSDMVGIRDDVRLQWGGDSLRMRPGTDNPELLPAGISTPVPDLRSGAPVKPFRVDLVLRGNDYLGLTPVGRVTRAELQSAWPSPSFQGNFLPEDHDVTAAGFRARWKVLDLNRNYPQQWTDGQYTLAGSDFGLQLLRPVNDYLKNTRTAKYAVLVVGLTFLIYFFFEMLQGLHIHPFQYFLVGLAISLFYLLLLSLSEHLGFNRAYLLAAVATIGLIVGYSNVLLASASLSATLGALLTAIYGFIFVILQLEDYALLAGSIGLFVTLAFVMFLSRRINWYGE